MEDEHSLYSRQLGIIPPERLNFLISIIGAGSIGSWLTLCLAKMGCSRIEVWDNDGVEAHNVANQLFKTSQVPLDKTAALADIVAEFTPGVIDPVFSEYTGDVLMGRIIISAVDNMETRKAIYEGNIGLDKILIDGRMGGNAIEIYIVKLNDVEQCKRYAETLFTDRQALPIPCSHRSVAYNGLTIAGMISSVVAKIAMEEEVPTEIMVDMKNYFLLK